MKTKKETQIVRALGRQVARELSKSDLEKISGGICTTAVGGGSRCFIPGGPVGLDFAP